MLNNQTGLKRLIFAHAAVGSELPPINEYTVTGNPAEFNTNLVRPLQSFEIPFSPVQSGSGDPSPSNVRPISGWAGITVTANGQTILAVWESVAGVVYGGTVDLVTGVMIAEYGISKVLTSSNVASTFYTRSGGVRFQLQQATDGNNEYGAGKKSVLMATNMGVHANGESANTNILPSVGVASGNSAFWIALPDSYGVTDLESAAAWLGENNLQFVYKFRDNITYQLSPTEIKTIIGQNSIGTNTNGTNTIKYLKRG